MKAFAVLLLTAGAALAQPTLEPLPPEGPQRFTRFGLAMGVYGLAGRGYDVQATMRLGSRYALGLGAFGTDVFSEPQRIDQNGIEAGVRQGYFVSATRYSGGGCGHGCGMSAPRASRFFVAVRAGVEEFRLRDTHPPPSVNGLTAFETGVHTPSHSELSTAWALMLLPHVGYQWFPRGQEIFYLRPWLGLSFTVLPGAAADLGWSPRLLAPAGGAHAGFEF
jgi:hypothetical protein